MSGFIAKKGICLNAKVDASEVGVELSKLGNFTPDTLVKVAANKRSPLHKYFEWDDSKAAHAYRLSQARHLVLSIGFEDAHGEFSRSFESVVIDSKRVYAPLSEIVKSADLVDQVLKSALNELLYWRAKHQKYKNFFGGVFDAIDKSEEAYRSTYEQESKKVRGGRGNKARHTAHKKGNGHRNNSRRQPVAS